MNTYDVQIVWKQQELTIDLVRTGGKTSIPLVSNEYRKSYSIIDTIFWKYIFFVHEIDKKKKTQIVYDYCPPDVNKRNQHFIDGACGNDPYGLLYMN